MIKDEVDDVIGDDDSDDVIGDDDSDDVNFTAFYCNTYATKCI